MILVKCKACGKRYDYYEHGCCPHCGAYNRPPHRDRVEADGTVRHLSDAEFFGRGKKAQNGKVCFEQDVCYEEQARRVIRTGPEESSPFDNISRPARKRPAESGADRRKKLIRTVAIVVVLVNLLPMLLAMCSFSDVEYFIDDVFSEVVGVDQVQPEPPSDGVTEYTTYVGNTFIWWDNDAAVVEVVMDQQDGTAFLDLTMWRTEAYDEPVVFYDTVDGQREKAGCDGISKLDEETYVYHYTLDGYQSDGECYAFFDGYNGNVYCEVKVPLTGEFVTPYDDTVVQAAYVAELGETFLWWDEEVVMEDAVVSEEGSYTEITLVMNAVSGDLEAPMIAYWNEDGQESLGYCDQGWLQGEDWIWIFRIYDRMPGTDCWAVFTEDTGEVRVLLN